MCPVKKKYLFAALEKRPTLETLDPPTITIMYFFNLFDHFPFLFNAADEGLSTGSSNLLVQHGLDYVYQKFFGKKTKESLSTFLTHLPGMNNNLND